MGKTWLLTLRGGLPNKRCDAMQLRHSMSRIHMVLSEEITLNLIFSIRGNEILLASFLKLNCGIFSSSVYANVRRTHRVSTSVSNSTLYRLPMFR